MDTKPYNVIYEDGSYQTFDMTFKQFEGIASAMNENQKFYVTEKFLLVLKHIRTVVEHKEPEVTHQVMEGLPDGLTPDQLEWLREQAEAIKEFNAVNGSDD